MNGIKEAGALPPHFLPPHFLPAQALLDELGIEEPKDIQIEAIAQFVGATVVYEPLQGSDARLIGLGSKAFITIDKATLRSRQRFSVAHELGHWMWDRGKTGFACGELHLSDDGKDAVREEPSTVERRANKYAVDLLLPERMFCRFAKGAPRTFATVFRLAELFQTSLTATAIRLVELSNEPVLLVCTTREKRKWTSRSRVLPRSIPLKEKLDPRTNASRLLASGEEQRSVDTLPAAAWFDDPRAAEMAVREETIRLTADMALSLISWSVEES